MARPWGGAPRGRCSWTQSSTSNFFLAGKGAVSCSYGSLYNPSWKAAKGAAKGGMATHSSTSATTTKEPNFDTDINFEQQLAHAKPREPCLTK